LALVEKKLQAIAVKSGFLRKLVEWLEKIQNPEGRKDIAEKLVLDKLGLGGLNEYAKKVLNPMEEQLADLNKTGVTTAKGREAMRKTREEQEAARSIKDVFDAMRGGGGGADRARFDQFRRIGSLGGFSGGAPAESPVLTFLQQWGPMVRDSVEAIDRKTPEPDAGGRN
jgi:hypothetical protein